MRKPTQLRIVFFAVALASYVLGSYLMPETIGQLDSWQSFYESLKQWNQQALSLGVATLLFFAVVPIAYWFLIIKPNSQAKWKILIVFSLSSLVARYHYPPEIAQYFEFIAWLRYPFIAVLLAIEFYLIFSVCRSIWQARKLSGDPRINLLMKYDEGSKERELGLMLAYEPAGWYYAIPRFSRNHVPSIGHLNLRSSSKKYFFPTLASSLSLMFISYFLLVDWSMLAAIVVSSVFFSVTFMVLANYRCSKYHSVYIRDDKLVINNSWWGMMVIELSDIAHCQEINKEASEKTDSETLSFGRSKPNLKLRFKTDQIYYSFLGQFSEKVSEVALSLHDAEKLLTHLQQTMSAS